MLLLPKSQVIRSIRKHAADSIDILFGDRLKNNSPEVVLKKPYLGARLNLVLATQFGGNHELAL